MKKSGNAFIAIGLMLFALFFGAGNLIFPVFMGQNSGVNTIPATIGFLVTGVGLPILGVAAIGYSGNDLQGLASRISRPYAIFFAVCLYLTIGPAFAIPRTATTSFEIAIAPFFGSAMKTTALYGFCALFFIVSWWLSVTPSKLVDRIGKVITPVLLLFLAALFVFSTVSPMGPWQEATAGYQPSMKALTQGFIDGYGTMDVLAAFVFGIIVVNAVRQYGAETPEEVAASTLRSGLIAGLCLGIIYIFLCILGASSVTVLGMQDNGAGVLVGAANHYFGSFGNIVMGVIVLLACLTTSVGLITSCGEYFSRLLPFLSFKKWVTVFAFVSFLVGLFGLTTIIKAAIPVLMFLYPLAIALIILSFTNSFFDGSRIVYRMAILFTFIPSLYDGIHTAGLALGGIDAFMKGLPFAAHGLAWVSFFIVGYVIGIVLSKVRK
ncbi:branched-chain amino acid transport system II carrier protein [uncultured Dialister sp.]|uniref:branched-chain amino acid transport system II carrier protein n=1 Tax=uncultured Dialister sp. TaxID=278064 RepID=UPI0025D4291F|nr:branched-chain amino acid transport system II carrier protein [uncultured Dialister sp.]